MRRIDLVERFDDMTRRGAASERLLCKQVSHVVVHRCDSSSVGLATLIFQQRLGGLVDQPLVSFGAHREDLSTARVMTDPPLA
ncbi:hypothetical protein AB0M48_29925 [Lentzea sp. NPDC051208]|uniref:hypothetical protein n=1 Tax=Lentzea sp. NPDC051208 TaxID=3154642 RepID=UPI0034219E81